MSIFSCLFPILFACILTGGCALGATNRVEQDTKQTNTAAVSHTEDTESSLWDCSVKRISSGETYDFSKFFDIDHGVGGSYSGALYLFDISGRTVSDKIVIGKDDRIAGFDFINKDIGWLIIQSHKEPAGELKSVILHTTDGGKKWSKQLDREAVEFSQVRFWDKYNGWIVGRTSPLDRSVETVKPVLLITSDGGQSWRSVYRSLGAEAENGYDNVIPFASDGALVVSSEGAIYRMSSGAARAERLTEFSKLDQTFISQIQLIEGGFILVGGADSKEGIWGVLGVYDGQWKQVTVPGINIKSAIVFSNKDLMISGYKKLTEVTGRPTPEYNKESLMRTNLKDALTIGILGGMSPESTVTYYQYIVRMHQAKFGVHNYPRIIIASVSFQKYVDWQHRGAWSEIAVALKGNFDLAALRPRAMRGLEGWNSDLVKTIHGYDAAVIWESAHASTGLE